MTLSLYKKDTKNVGKNIEEVVEVNSRVNSQIYVYNIHRLHINNSTYFNLPRNIPIVNGPTYLLNYCQYNYNYNPIQTKFRSIIVFIYICILYIYTYCVSYTQ